LLLAIDVIRFLERLGAKERDRLLNLFDQMAQHPANHTDYEEVSADGRLYGVHVIGHFVIRFWDDFADRHFKIMELEWTE
jgi:hypothetical protein